MMKTIHIPDPESPPADAIEQGARELRAGGLVAFPTETVYGLGANALDPAAVARIFAAKGRPGTNPLIVHVPDAAAARAVVDDWPAEADRLARRFWPGPLTLVLPKADRIPGAVTAGGPTVAVRVPAHPVALALLRAAGVPVAAPSANRSNRISPTRAEHVRRSLAGCGALLLDAGACPGGIESTVLDLTSSPPRVLRPGLVTPGEVGECLGRPVAQTALKTPGPARSPGMGSRHYAPETRLELVDGDATAHVSALAKAGIRVGWMTGVRAAAAAGCVVVHPMAADPDGYAAQLYVALHTLDEQGLDVVVAELPPETDAWLGVRDRLLRAAAR